VLPAFNAVAFLQRLAERVTCEALYFAYSKASEADVFYHYQGGRRVERYEHVVDEVTFESELGTRPPGRRADPLNVVNRAFRRLDAWVIDTGLTSSPDASGDLFVDLAGVEPEDVAAAHLVSGVVYLGD
jgi:hypothetical protein